MSLRPSKSMSEYINRKKKIVCLMLDITGLDEKLPCYLNNEGRWMVPITMLHQTHFSNQKLGRVERVMHMFADEGLTRMTSLEIHTLRNWLNFESLCDKRGDKFGALTETELACSVADVQKHYNKVKKVVDDRTDVEKVDCTGFPDLKFPNKSQPKPSRLFRDEVDDSNVVSNNPPHDKKGPKPSLQNGYDDSYPTKLNERNVFAKQQEPTSLYYASNYIVSYPNIACSKREVIKKEKSNSSENESKPKVVVKRRFFEIPQKGNPPASGTEKTVQSKKEAFKNESAQTLTLPKNKNKKQSQSTKPLSCKDLFSEADRFESENFIYTTSQESKSMSFQNDVKTVSTASEPQQKNSKKRRSIEKLKTQTPSEQISNGADNVAGVSVTLKSKITIPKKMKNEPDNKKLVPVENISILNREKIKHSSESSFVRSPLSTKTKDPSLMLVGASKQFTSPTSNRIVKLRSDNKTTIAKENSSIEKTKKNNALPKFDNDCSKFHEETEKSTNDRGKITTLNKTFRKTLAENSIEFRKKFMKKTEKRNEANECFRSISGKRDFSCLNDVAPTEVSPPKIQKGQLGFRRSFYNSKQKFYHKNYPNRPFEELTEYNNRSQALSLNSDESACDDFFNESYQEQPKLSAMPKFINQHPVSSNRNFVRPTFQSFGKNYPSRSFSGRKMQPMFFLQRRNNHIRFQGTHVQPQSDGENVVWPHAKAQPFQRVFERKHYPQNFYPQYSRNAPFKSNRLSFYRPTQNRSNFFNYWAVNNSEKFNPMRNADFKSDQEYSENLELANQTDRKTYPRNFYWKKPIFTRHYKFPPAIKYGVTPKESYPAVDKGPSDDNCNTIGKKNNASRSITISEVSETDKSAEDGKTFENVTVKITKKVSRNISSTQALKSTTVVSKQKKKSVLQSDCRKQKTMQTTQKIVKKSPEQNCTPDIIKEGVDAQILSASTKASIEHEDCSMSNDFVVLDEEWEEEANATSLSTTQSRNRSPQSKIDLSKKTNKSSKMVTEENTSEGKDETLLWPFSSTYVDFEHDIFFNFHCSDDDDASDDDKSSVKDDDATMEQDNTMPEMDARPHRQWKKVMLQKAAQQEQTLENSSNTILNNMTENTSQSKNIPEVVTGLLEDMLNTIRSSDVLERQSKEDQGQRVVSKAQNNRTPNQLMKGEQFKQVPKNLKVKEGALFQRNLDIVQSVSATTSPNTVFDQAQSRNNLSARKGSENLTLDTETENTDVVTIAQYSFAIARASNSKKAEDKGEPLLNETADHVSNGADITDTDPISLVTNLDKNEAEVAITKKKNFDANKNEKTIRKQNTTKPVSNVSMHQKAKTKVHNSKKQNSLKCNTHSKNTLEIKETNLARATSNSAQRQDPTDAATFPVLKRRKQLPSISSDEEELENAEVKTSSSSSPNSPVSTLNAEVTDDDDVVLMSCESFLPNVRKMFIPKQRVSNDSNQSKDNKAFSESKRKKKPRCEVLRQVNTGKQLKNASSTKTSRPTGKTFLTKTSTGDQLKAADTSLTKTSKDDQLKDADTSSKNPSTGKVGSSVSFKNDGLKAVNIYALRSQSKRKSKCQQYKENKKSKSLESFENPKLTKLQRKKSDNIINQTTSSNRPEEKLVNNTNHADAHLGIENTLKNVSQNDVNKDNLFADNSLQEKESKQPSNNEKDFLKTTDSNNQCEMIQTMQKEVVSTNSIDTAMLDIPQHNINFEERQDTRANAVREKEKKDSDLKICETSVSTPNSNLAPTVVTEASRTNLVLTDSSLSSDSCATFTSVAQPVVACVDVSSTDVTNISRQNVLLSQPTAHPLVSSRVEVYNTYKNTLPSLQSNNVQSSNLSFGQAAVSSTLKLPSVPLTTKLNTSMHDNNNRIVETASLNAMNQRVLSHERPALEPTKTFALNENASMETYYHGLLEVEMLAPLSCLQINENSTLRPGTKVMFCRRRIPYVQITKLVSKQYSPTEQEPFSKSNQLKDKESSDAATMEALMIRIRDVAFTLQQNAKDMLNYVVQQKIKCYYPNEFTENLYKQIYNPVARKNYILLLQLGLVLSNSLELKNEDSMINLEDYLRIIIPNFYKDHFCIDKQHLPDLIKIRTYKPIQEITPQVIETFSNSFLYNCALIGEDVKIKQLIRTGENGETVQKTRKRRNSSKDISGENVIVAPKTPLTNTYQNQKRLGPSEPATRLIQLENVSHLTKKQRKRSSASTVTTRSPRTKPCIQNMKANAAKAYVTSHGKLPLHNQLTFTPHQNNLVNPLPRQGVTMYTPYAMISSTGHPPNTSMHCQPNVVNTLQPQFAATSNQFVSPISREKLSAQFLSSSAKEIDMMKNTNNTSGKNSNVSNQLPLVPCLGHTRPSTVDMACNVNHSHNANALSGLQVTSRATVQSTKESQIVQTPLNSNQDNLTIGAKFIIENDYGRNGSPRAFNDLQKFLSSLQPKTEASTMNSNANNNQTASCEVSKQIFPTLPKRCEITTEKTVPIENTEVPLDLTLQEASPLDLTSQDTKMQLITAMRIPEKTNSLLQTTSHQTQMHNLNFSNTSAGARASQTAKSAHNITIPQTSVEPMLRIDSIFTLSNREEKRSEMTTKEFFDNIAMNSEPTKDVEIDLNSTVAKIRNLKKSLMEGNLTI